MDVGGQLDSPAHQEGFHAPGLLFFLAANRKHGPLGGEARELQKIRRNEEQAQSQQSAEYENQNSHVCHLRYSMGCVSLITNAVETKITPAQTARMIWPMAVCISVLNQSLFKK